MLIIIIIIIITTRLIVNNKAKNLNSKAQSRESKAFHTLFPTPKT